MKTCPSCGKELPDEASFCVYCMTQLSPVAEVGTPRAGSAGNSISTKILTAFCVLLTAAVIILAVRTSDSNGNTPPADSGSPAGSPTDSPADSQAEQYSALCQSLIDKMAQSSAALDKAAKSGKLTESGFWNSYDPFAIAQYGSAQNVDDVILLRTRLRSSAGDVYIEYARETYYIKCTVLGVPQDNSPYQSPSLDAFKLMQVLYTARTGSTDTAVLDFLYDNEAYPLSEENANWSDTDEYIHSWYDSVINDDTKVSVTRKDGEFDNINVILLVRTRQYGGTSFYDYQFMMY